MKEEQMELNGLIQKVMEQMDERRGVFQILLTNKKTNIQPLFVLKYNCNNNPTGGDCMFLKIYFISILKGCK